MDELEDVCRDTWPPWRKELPLLHGQAAIAELASVLDMRQAPHHLLEPVERVEAEVAEPGAIATVPQCVAPPGTSGAPPSDRACIANSEIVISGEMAILAILDP